MLKKRIIATVVVKGGVVVQSIGFNRFLPIGNLNVALEFLDNWGIDEIVVLDIDATVKGQYQVYDNLKSSVVKCFVPLTYGGGLKDLEMVHEVFKKGADKVSFNQAFQSNRQLIKDTAASFGQQSVVLSLDFVETKSGAFVYDYCRSAILAISLQDAITQAEDLGVGEILINCVNRDGKYNGFAVDTVRALKNPSVPLILAGGARTYHHFEEAFELPQVAALAAGNMFHFVEHSVSKLKTLLPESGIRQDSFFNYHSHEFEGDQRLKKLPDETLENLLYEKLLDREI